MKYIKYFENIDESEISRICDQYGIENWTIREGLVDVDGYVNLGDKGLEKLPLKFGVVSVKSCFKKFTHLLNNNIKNIKKWYLLFNI